MVVKGMAGRERDGLKFGAGNDKPLHQEWINNKFLIYSTGNYIQYPVINHNGKEYKEECIYMYN